MASGPLELEETRSLDELIEKHLQVLFNKLARPHTLDDIEADLVTLNDLIHSYKRKDKLLEKLIDDTTPEEKRRQIRETLIANRIKVADNRSELEQLHAKSHQLLERSMLLIMKAQWQIHKEAHKNSGYELETCNTCEGTGRDVKGHCLLCKGTGNVLSRKSTTDTLT
jgi:excinuclease UvrABC ATPase subunit